MTAAVLAGFTVTSFLSACHQREAASAPTAQDVCVMWALNRIEHPRIRIIGADASLLGTFIAHAHGGEQIVVTDPSLVDQVMGPSGAIGRMIVHCEETPSGTAGLRIFLVSLEYGNLGIEDYRLRMIREDVQGWVIVDETLTRVS
jgi:hypothetical protein